MHVNCIVLCRFRDPHRGWQIFFLIENIMVGSYGGQELELSKHPKIKIYYANQNQLVDQLKFCMLNITYMVILYNQKFFLFRIGLINIQVQFD